MQLYLCEKPSQARDIARVLGVRQKGDGCLKSSDKIVTWCFGHLLEMASPDKYDDALKRWQFDTLPIIPQAWKLTVKKASRKQFNIIQQLLKNSSSVVIATDADREGESIAREILELCRWRGPISRLWLSALDDSSIRKALNNILPSSKTEPLYYAGLGRARADWLVGMNLTRAYTLIGRQRGHENVLSVGRVQTPTLNLVVQRDATIEGFKPIPYFDLFAVFGVNDDQFRAKWLPPESVADTEGRCTSQPSALNVAQKINGQRGTVTKAETELKRESAPLPFDLSSLQQEASKCWGMGAQAVLDTAQALYETHKALTYPRTDCRYLPDSQHAEVPQVFTALIQSDSQYKVHIDSADTSRRSKVWNDRKITAHHAIIPTATATDVSRMNENERRLYHLVCLRYIAQFHPDHEYNQTIIEVSVCGELFRASGRIPKKLGWRTIISNDQQETKGEEHQTLPTVSKNNIAHVLETNIEDKQTKPPARFTEGTLIAAMKSVGKDINDPRLKKILRETSGIGTEATRAGIIETLLQRGFIQKQKKHLISTKTGRTLIGILPDVIKNPTTTALWEQGLDDIAQGKGELSAFLSGQCQWLTDHLRQLKQQQGDTVNSGSFNNGEQHSCPDCGHPLQRRKGRNGFFWGCSSYPDCKTTRPDNRGKPGTLKSKALGNHRSISAKAGDSCPECKSGKLVQRSVRSGKNEGKPFIGCTQFPKCKYFSWLSN